jgi:hypothetical protein
MTGPDNPGRVVDVVELIVVVVVVVLIAVVVVVVVVRVVVLYVVVVVDAIVVVVCLVVVVEEEVAATVYESVKAVAQQLLLVPMIALHVAVYVPADIPVQLKIALNPDQ